MTGDEAPGISRKPPGRLGRRFARAPRYLYRARLGWVLGRRFVMFEHIGRKTGLTRETVVEVIRHDEVSLDVAAAWGKRSDWFRNVVAHPAVRVSSGTVRRAPATASVIEREEAARVFVDYVDQHPRAARALRSALGIPLDDPAEMAASIPVVRFALKRP